MSLSYLEIKDNISKINSELIKYPNAKLQAVIKTKTNEEIKEVIDNGLIDFVGENHAQEFLYHYPIISKIKTDFIGKLQTNKIKYIIGKINMIESIDSVHLLSEIEKRSKNLGIITKGLIEINIANEENKSGIMLKDFESLLKYSETLTNTYICGLMTVSINTDDSKEKSKYFANLRKIRDDYYNCFKGYDDHPILSMGMSNSYKEALDEGSDIIRIGTGIFGERLYTNV